MTDLNINDNQPEFYDMAENIQNPGLETAAELTANGSGANTGAETWAETEAKTEAGSGPDTKAGTKTGTGPGPKLSQRHLRARPGLIPGLTQMTTGWP